jgi:hypothetical protein
MTRRWMWTGLAALLIVFVGGGLYYARRTPAAQPAQRPRDPGFALVLAIRALERNPETRLSKEQIARVLPFIKALKDVPPADAEAAAVIARAVRDTFTPEQIAALEEERRQFLERQRSQGVPAGSLPAGDATGGEGVGPPRGLGASGGQGAISDEQRAQFRARAFERMIRYLERRMK